MFPAIEMKGVPIAVNDASRHFRNKSPLVAQRLPICAFRPEDASPYKVPP